MARKKTPTYQIKVSLNGIRPPIWRRILVPGDTTLLDLHDILQIVMGWENYHLHMFQLEEDTYGNPEDDEYGDFGTLDESKFKLSDLVTGIGQRFTYEYDFGDRWDHTLLVEKILPPEEGAGQPACLKGKRACPPEDVGGVWGYQVFLDAIQNPEHDEHENYMDWIGGEFYPDAFDIEKVNARLRSTAHERGAETSNPWFHEEVIPDSWELAPGVSWTENLPDDQRAVAEDLPLRRDVVTLITYIRDNKVTGTQSTGNLPLKVVREVCARFVIPPVLEDSFYTVRSEYDVWPLFFRHLLASVSGLVTGGPGRRWRLTLIGESFLVEPPALQVWRLCYTWCTRINWTIASMFDLGEELAPSELVQFVFEHLLDLPVGDRVPFEQFTSQFFEKIGLTWPAEDEEFGRRVLDEYIEDIVIHPLAEFGVLQVSYIPHKFLGPEFKEVSSFRVTPFGRGLLETIRDGMR